MPGYVQTDAERNAWMLDLYERYMAATLTSLAGLSTPSHTISLCDEITRLAIQATVKYRVDE